MNRSVLQSTLAACLSVLLAAPAAQADVRLPAIFGDNMVLQRETDAVLWGWARPGEKVTVTASWSDAPRETVTDADGRFRLMVPTAKAGGPFKITVAADNSVTFTNIMLGEVWLCSGQSNMEWPLAATDNAEATIAGAKHPNIRLFTVENTISAHKRIDVNGNWSECTPKSVGTFSAVAYYFACALQDRLGTDVPIGLIAADWGGTPAESWVSDAGLRDFPEFAETITFLNAMGKDPAAREKIMRERGEGWWNSLDRISKPSNNWATADFDDAGWKACALPATWGDGGSDGLKGFDGVGYFRRVIDLPESWNGKPATLELGPIDDYDDAWVNGKPVGATHADNQWAEPRKYAVPEGVLKTGRNIIAVRVLDAAGIGGMNGKPEQLALRAGGSDGLSVPLAGEWRYMKGAEAKSLPARQPNVGIGPNMATTLYNGMIAPIVGFPIRGAIWYQGESNVGRAEQYGKLFPALIRDWRARWREAGAKTDLPFYFVQIAPFNYGGDGRASAALRDAQRTSLSTPNTGMAVTLDIADPTDIHPRNKKDVGARLAMWALAQTYGQEILPSGPLFKVARAESQNLRIEFDHSGNGLEFRGDEGTKEKAFWIAGDDRKFRIAKAEIDGDTIVLSHTKVPKPVAVRYAWSNAPAATLFNKDGLPASSFRSDTWGDDGAPPSNDDEMQGYRTTEPGYKDLFNGRDLAGWVNVNCAPSTWTIGADDEGGPLISCSGVPTGVLRTDRMFENFELELEYRHHVPGGNAGLFVWSDALTARGQPFTRSVEVQVMDGQEGEGYTSDGDIFPIHGAKMKPVNPRGNGDRAFPTEKRANRAPLWNHYHVICNNGEISLALNGKVVTRGTEITPRKGYICLEAEGTPVDFRNIRIKELPSTAGGATSEQTAAADQGFVSLYTGVDFAGWKLLDAHKGHWSANDWTIAFDGKAEGDLWSEKSYKDFTMICDWRWSGEPKDADLPVVLSNGEYATDTDGKQKSQRVKDAGDSGIYLRGSSKSQINMWCWPIGSGEVHGYRTDPTMSPEVRAGATPKVVADAPLGRWNRFEITMKGDRLTVVLNGKTVIEDAYLPGIAAEGPIALQAHGSPIEFSNIYIKELK